MNVLEFLKKVEEQFRVICGVLELKEDKVDLKGPLRKSENNDLLKETIYEAISRKPKGHDFVIERKKEEKFVPRHMSVTGG